MSSPRAEQVGEKSPLLKMLDEDDDAPAWPVKDANDDAPLSVATKLGFAFGGPPNQLTHTIVGFQLNFFLLRVVLLQPSAVGTIVLLGRFWDGIMDPTVGTMTTRTRSRWGSLKPWLGGSIIPLALSYVAIWSVPPWYSYEARMGFVTAAYLMYQVCISMYYVPYTALTMHLSKRSADIDSATLYRMVAETLAVFVAAILTKVIQPFAKSAEELCDGEHTTKFCVYSSIQLGYMGQNTIVAAICIISGIGVMFSIGEQKLPPGTAAPPDPVLKGLWTVVRTRSFRYLTIMFLGIWMAVALIQTNFLLYCEIVLGLEFDEASDLLLTLLGVCVLSEPFWFFLMVKMGKKPTFIFSLFLTLPVIVGFFFLNDRTPLWALHLTFAALGVSIAAAYLVPATMIPDVINEAALRDKGQRREAMFYSYSVFFQKLGAGLAIYASNEILENVGKYDSLKADNSQSKDTLRLLTGIVPALMTVMSICVAFFYPLNTEKEKQIAIDLERLRASLHGLQTETPPEKAEDLTTSYYSEEGTGGFAEGGYATDC
mmetsp:Transcript_29919/g.78453  ORF Transcript_29919/g.78453 Transcript_29919/m.78453 type:complete len:542 (+) Transcript_29919:47-1672(+)